MELAVKERKFPEEQALLMSVFEKERAKAMQRKELTAEYHVRGKE